MARDVNYVFFENCSVKLMGLEHLFFLHYICKAGNMIFELLGIPSIGFSLESIVKIFECSISTCKYIFSQKPRLNPIKKIVSQKV